jgi:cobalt/nickel transport protein
MILPSDDIVTMKDNKVINLRAWLLHPYEKTVLKMDMPRHFEVHINGEDIDLLKDLKPLDLPDGNAFEASYKIRKPGDHIIHMLTEPYWDGVEGTFIVHHTKVVVNALGKSGKWDDVRDQEVEIVPLSRPYGLWVGNVFQGQVLFRGKPAKGAVINIERYNENGEFTAPSTHYATQAVLTDPNGIFTYAMPFEGWWGFSVIFDSGRIIKHKGKKGRLGLGATFWVKALSAR